MQSRKSTKMERDLYELISKKKDLENMINHAEFHCRVCINKFKYWLCSCQLKLKLLEAELRVCNSDIDKELELVCRYTILFYFLFYLIAFSCFYRQPVNVN
uniref:AsIV-cont00003-ORF2 n=1 Tax=Apophua simplicipes ichnovirus TaxID=1329648 RepID=S5DMF5_9VIRU|nr:AsIV-cont00003-ORF2 [Apophua simplicipes ichnovirus]